MFFHLKRNVFFAQTQKKGSKRFCLLIGKSKIRHSQFFMITHNLSAVKNPWVFQFLEKPSLAGTVNIHISKVELIHFFLAFLCQLRPDRLCIFKPANVMTTETALLQNHLAAYKFKFFFQIHSP